MINDIYIIDVENNSRQNGIGTYLRTVIPVIKRSGRNVSLISLNSGVISFEKGERIDCTDYRFPTVDYNANAKAFCEILVSNIKDSDTLAFWINYTPCLAFVKELKSHFPKCRIIATVHDQGWTRSLLGKPELLREIMIDKVCPEIVSEQTFNFITSYSLEEKELYDNCCAIIALSESAHDVFTQIYGVEKSKVFLIHNAVDEILSRRNYRIRSKMREKYCIRTDEKVILYAGRPVKAKGFEVLLKAFEILHDYRKDVRLIVAGRLSDISKVEYLYRKVAPWTTLLGLIPRSEVKNLYSMSDIGVLPSFTEQCSFSGLEMMAHRLPIVASDGYCVTDMFKDGINAKTVYIPENPLEDDPFALRLALAMNSLLDERPNKIKSMLAESTRIVKTVYSPEVFANKYTSMLDSL